VTVIVVALPTTPAVIVNLADVRPAGTITLAGTESATPELERVTTAPAAGAGPVRATVLVVEVTPDTIVAGESMTEDTDGGTTDALAVFDAPP
jgi:hypothetical protein